MLVADASDHEPDRATTRVIGRPTGGRSDRACHAANKTWRSAASRTCGAATADDWFDFRAGASLSGTLDGRGGNDSLDYRDYTTSVNVDLATGAATGISGGAAGGLATMVDLDLDSTPGPETASSSIENVFGGNAADTIRGDADRNILGDGFGSDRLDGGAGDDTFRLEPAPNSFGPSADRVSRYQRQRYDRLPLRHDGGDSGVTFDMDLVGYDSNGNFVFTDTSSPPEVEYPQDVYGGDGTSTVSLIGRGDFVVTPDQVPPAYSPFENIVGSRGADVIDIDPLPVVRRVDGNFLNTSPEASPLDELYFNGGSSEVIDTGTSLTALGIGSILYANMENVEPYNARPRIIDNDDPGYSQVGHFRRTTAEGYLGDERTAETYGDGGTNVARWTFSGVTPGWYRVAATWIPGANRATDASYRVLDGTTPITPVVAGSRCGGRGADQSEGGSG